MSTFYLYLRISIRCGKLSAGNQAENNTWFHEVHQANATRVTAFGHQWYGLGLQLPAWRWKNISSWAKNSYHLRGYGTTFFRKRRHRDGAKLDPKSYHSLNFILSVSSVSPRLIQLLLSKFALAGYFVSADTDPNPDPIKVSGKTSNNFSCTRTWLTVKKMFWRQYALPQRFKCL